MLCGKMNLRTCERTLDFRSRSDFWSKKLGGAKAIYPMRVEDSVRLNPLHRLLGREWRSPGKGKMRESRIGSSLLKVIDTTGC